MASAGSALAILVGAGIFALASTSKASSSSSGTPPPVSLPLPASPEYDKNLPMILQLTVDQELATDTDPNSLLTFANSLKSYFPIAAAALAARAAALQTANPPPAPPAPVAQPPAPVVPTAPVVVSPAAPVVLPPPVVSPATPIVPAQGITITLVPYEAGAVDVTDTAIPGNYQTTSTETQNVQTALNAWAPQVNYAGPEIPLVVDGMYGPSSNPPTGANSNTQLAAANFQTWVNATQNPQTPLVVDGLAGPLTQAWLGFFLGSNGAFATDGGY